MGDAREEIDGPDEAELPLIAPEQPPMDDAAGGPQADDADG